MFSFIKFELALEANNQCSDIFMRLLTLSCKAQAQKAWK